MSYFHAGGIDRPLSIWKAGYHVILPHQNWRGQFAKGTYTSGQLSDCAAGQTTGCTPIAWPGHRTTAWHEQAGSGPDIRTWHGGLVDGMRDATGQMYMRNRYYDPATGQFTQADPIGLAGGLNAYGFANGDPVSYDDPYGLCSTKIDKGTGESVDGGTVCKLDPIVVTATPDDQYHDRCEVAGLLSNYVRALGRNPFTFADGSYPAEFDFKFNNRGDLFQVGDGWLRADEFGNFAAGYAGQHVGGEGGHGAMLAGGLFYAMSQRPYRSGEHWSDRESRPMINAGAARARYEQAHNGRPRGMRGGVVINPGYVEPLMSTAGCN